MNDISISIDGQLHVRKLCERYLPEREMALLEWIRFARLRQARVIDISLKADETTVRDDGQAISPTMWQAMNTLLQSSDSDEIERSIEILKPVRGIGILAPLALGCEGFTMTSPAADGEYFLSHGQALAGNKPRSQGRHVILRLGPRGGNFNREAELLQRILPLVDAEITLNSQTVPRRRHALNTFLSLKVYQEDQPVGSVSLPRSCNHSSLELCHGDIPWRTAHFPPRQGRVFWARLDSVLGEEDLGPLMEKIDRANILLLEYIRDHFRQLPKNLLPRAEELLLEWSKPQAPHFPIMDLPLFRMSGQKEHISLSGLLSLRSRTGTLTATIMDQGQSDQLRGNGVLLLSRKQADFLTRSAEIPLSFTGSSQSGRMPFIPRYKLLLLMMVTKLDRLASFLFAPKSRSESFGRLEETLKGFLINDPEWNLVQDISSFQIELRNYRGIWPSHADASKKRISLHARHPLTRALLLAIGEERPTFLFIRSLIPPELI